MYFKVKFPCGYEWTYFTIIQLHDLDYPLECPLHGKNCGIKEENNENTHTDDH